MHTSTLVSLTLALAPIAHASFSLNVSGPDWDYVAKDLANTTSAACIAAYSAPIDCDATLLGLVASMRPAFDPTSDDLDNTCTSTCFNSLDAYVDGVQKACRADGDAAQEYIGPDYDSPMGLVPVEVVGEVFQYTLAQSCRGDDDGGYCYISSPSFNSISSSDCPDTCDGSFFALAHSYAGSAYEFNGYWLVPQSDWWAEYCAEGWKNALDCGLDFEANDDDYVSASASASASATASGSRSASKTKTSNASAATLTSGESTATGEVASSTTTASATITTKATGSGSGTAAAASATTSTASGGAVAGMQVGGSVMGLAGLGLVGMLVL
ncbi:ADP-ribosylation factor-related 1 protein [Rutstroemia sp. NJR-2017a WRK4]|nr:ADP-ribosylation factor-related 1 protein [Rutstroemia sp. NJR-2017a WRK4]